MLLLGVAWFFVSAAVLVPITQRVVHGELSDREWQADMYGCQQLILELWGREETQGEAWHASCRTLDSLAGAGSADRLSLINHLNLRARQIDKYG